MAVNALSSLFSWVGVNGYSFQRTMGDLIAGGERGRFRFMRRLYIFVRNFELRKRASIGEPFDDFGLCGL